MPIGRFAKIAISLLGIIPLNARLCVISWMARKRLWLAVPPITYAQKMHVKESGEVWRRRMARDICRRTTSETTYLVSGSCPINFVTFIYVHKRKKKVVTDFSTLTSGCAFMIAILRVRWGSSVINHKKSLGSWGGAGYTYLSPSPCSWVANVRLGDLLHLSPPPSSKPSAPPKRLKSDPVYI